MEARLFEEGTVPEWTTAAWYATREVAPHLEQAGHTERLQLAASMLRGLPADLTVVDLGAGDGGLLSILGRKGWGYDLAPANVAAAAARGVTVTVADIMDVDALKWGDIAVATEILEHLVDPHGYVRAIKSKYLLASSPYTETKDSHYEFHTFAWDLVGYKTMLENAGWRVLKQDTAWICQCVLAVRES